MKLHPIQSQLLSILDESTNNKKISLRDLGEKLGIGRENPQKIAHHVNQLEKKGLIRKDPITKQISTLSNAIKDVVYLDLVALTSCGEEGLYNQEHIIDSIPVPTKIFGIAKSEDYFLVKADGNSMKPIISDSDILLVKKENQYIGDGVYVCIHNGLPKTKKLIKKGNNYLLHSFNKDYDELTIDKDDDFSIEGKIKANLKIIH